MTKTENAAMANESVLTSEALLERWQGNRRLSRRVIDAFPEDKLFSFSVGSMRPFSALAMEMIGMAEPSIRGVATGKWEWAPKTAPTTKKDLLALWDQTTDAINKLWPTIPPHRFAEIDKAFGQWEGPGIDGILYLLENEVHHRGQGYVYLRALGIEPPAFWERT